MLSKINANFRTVSLLVILFDTFVVTFVVHYKDAPADLVVTNSSDLLNIWFSSY